MASKYTPQQAQLMHVYLGNGLGNTAIGKAALEALIQSFGGDMAALNRATNDFSSGSQTGDYDPTAIAQARGVAPGAAAPVASATAVTPGRTPILTLPPQGVGGAGTPFGQFASGFAPNTPQTGGSIGSMPDPGYGNLPPSGTGFRLNPFSNPNWKGGIGNLPQAGAVGAFQGSKGGPSITDLLPGYGMQQNLQGFGIPGFEQNQLVGGGSWAGTTFNPPAPRDPRTGQGLYIPPALTDPTNTAGTNIGATGAGTGGGGLGGQGSNAGGAVAGPVNGGLNVGSLLSGIGSFPLLGLLGKAFGNLSPPPAGQGWRDPAQASPDEGYNGDPRGGYDDSAPVGSVSVGDVADVTGDVGTSGDSGAGPGEGGGGEGGSGNGPMGARKRVLSVGNNVLPVDTGTAAPSGLGGAGFGNFQPGFAAQTPATTGAPAANNGSILLGELNPETGARADPGYHWGQTGGDAPGWVQVKDDTTSGSTTKAVGGFHITPAQPWVTTPYNQTYSGRPAPYANIHDQLGQAMMGQPVAYPGFAWANPASLAALKGVGPPGGWTQMLGFNPGAASGYNPISPYSPAGGK